MHIVEGLPALCEIQSKPLGILATCSKQSKPARKNTKKLPLLLEPEHGIKGETEDPTRLLQKT
jgi:hypothetical protein